jgi:succinate-semialdehyde dehydrogenase/glutarate-semialdehyde dehydrogenase
LVEESPVEQGLQESFVAGVLNNRRAVDKVAELLDDTKAHVAKVALSGNAHASGGLFYAPTILTELNDHMQLRSTEIFGPVFPV